MSREISYINSPLGLLKITIKHDKLKSIEFSNNQFKKENDDKEKSKLMKNVIKQIEEYFNQNRKIFDVDIEIEGTAFQKDIYNTLLKTKYGETISYKELAIKSGHPKAYRACGSALKTNKIPIIIPCHRVIKSNGAIGNYNGGNWRKKRLLKLEGSDNF